MKGKIGLLFAYAALILTVALGVYTIVDGLVTK